ncbi:unnamed protein product [Symbiodinium sp. CCMP2592]|nr:unnamed protein product [Symbiodinium sp. CCMP2592]
MTLVDSEAAFAARCKEICGDDSLHTLLQASGVQTHSALAFSCGTPKAQPTEAEFKAFADSVVGSPASIGRVSQLKRLHFESSTLVIAQLRALVEGDSTDAGKRLPAAEKSARLADAKRRLKGLVIEDEMEPSHALIDAVSHMGESNAVVWIPPSKCTKRDAELKLGLRDKQKYLTVQEQSVTLAPAPDKIVAEHGTPLEVQWCLQRRGLAFFMCGFMEWETHEKWVASLLRCLSSDVPPGYAPISMQQILRADSEIFLLLAREVKRVKPDSSGVMEMDVLMNRFRHDPRITTYLQPLQRGSASQGVASPSLAGEVGSSFPDLRPSKRQKKRDAKLKAPIKTANLPEELKSCPYHADSSGNRFCWQFNLGKCNAECKGSPPACSRGVHGCMTCRRLGHGHSACWFAQAGKGKGKKGKGKGDKRQHLQPVGQDEAESVTKPFINVHDDSERDSVLSPPEADVNAACSAFNFSFAAFMGSTSSVPGDPCESLASKILEHGNCSSEQLLELSNMLPSETPTRSDGAAPSGRAFTTGAYYHCGTVGVRHNARAYPLASRLLATLAASVFSNFHFTSVGLFKDVKTRRHRDLRNLPGSLNGVAPLRPFCGGAVRLHHPSGPEDLLVSAGPVTFDATVEHETLDWTNGPRLVLVAFSVYGIYKIPVSDESCLRSLGFALPGVTDATASVPALSHTTTAASDTVSGVIIDVFAGDAAFCKAAHKAGFRALAFDLKPQRAQFPIQPLDITQADELAVLLEVISEHAGATSLVQFTVPCLSTFFTSKTGSWSFAELLVDAVFQLCSHCRAVGVPFAILHPATSRFWHMPSCQHFFQAADGEWTTFDQCMHGGAQDRRAFWWASTALLRPLQATCSKDHKHYSQAASAPQWPHLLWDRAVELLCQHSGFTPTTSSLFGPPGRDLRPAMGKQSRKARPLVSEFCKYDAWAVPLRAEQPVLQLLRCYPKGARAVRRKLVDPGLVRVCVLPSVDLCKVDDVLSSPWTWSTKHCKHDAHTPTKDFSDVCGLLPPTEHSPVLEVVWIGIPREPDDFLRRAVAAGHPESLLDVEADPHMTLLIDNLLNSNVKQPDKGLHEVQRWTELRSDLSESQDVCKKEWPIHVAQVLDAKPTLLMDELLTQHDFPDRHLVKHIGLGL